jgi:hypothetical protein
MLGVPALLLACVDRWRLGLELIKELGYAGEKSSDNTRELELCL